MSGTPEGCRRASLKHYPGMNRFVLDWLAGDPKATRLLAREPRSTERRPPRPPAALVDALIASNRRWGSFVEEDVRAWAGGESLSIVAGQQAGFAGGPLYTLAKLASLLKMKREFEREGKRVTLFFWLATEDHDYAEVAQLRVPVSTIPEVRDVNRQLDLLSIRAARAVDSHQVAGRLPLPESLIGELLALYDLERPAWLREGITFADSFAELLVSVAGEPVVLVDSLLPELRRAAAPLFEQVFARWDEIQNALTQSASEMESAGYTPQIEQRDGQGYTLFYRIGENGARDLIARPEPAGDPATISTSALTRPVLQDFVLAPDVFVGGPAEVAYYAQQTVLHEMLGVAMPRVALRGHVLVAPQRLLRAIDRYEIDPSEWFGPADEVIARREARAADEIRATAESARRDLVAALTRIGELALPADHAIARALNRSIGHIEYHFDKLTARAIRALVRKDRERHAAIRELVATLYPDGRVQDRAVAWVPFWFRYGKHLLETMIADIEPDCDSFRILGL